jgi:hypothetical protein
MKKRAFSDKLLGFWGVCLATEEFQDFLYIPKLWLIRSKVRHSDPYLCNLPLTGW